MSPVSWLHRIRHLDVLLVTSGIWFLAKFTRYAFPPLFGTFQQQYAVSSTTLGLLFSVLMLVYAVMQFPSGALADRLGTVRVISAGVLVLSVAAVGLAALQPFYVLVASMVLIGLGTGVHKTVAINLLATVYPARTGRTLGTMDAIGELGGVAAPTAVIAVLSSAHGWPVLFLAVGCAGVVLAVAFVRWVPRRLPGDPTTPDGSTPAGEADLLAYFGVLRHPTVGGFVLVVIAYAFAFNGLVAFLPLFLATSKGLSTAQAGLLYATLFAVSLAQPVTGGIADRFGRYRLMSVTLGLAGVALGALLAASSLPAIGLLVGLVGLGGHGFRPVRESHLVAILPEAGIGGSLGLIRTIMMGAGAVAPAVVGYVAESTTYATSFLVLAVVFGASAVGVAALAVLESPDAASRH